jgi:energy-coupling factor transporter transmembrane protein EcfT
MNRTYSIIFSFIAILLFVLLFFLIKNIKLVKVRQVLVYINGFALIISIFTLVVFYINIDPDVQFRDEKILFINKENRNEKIIKQYDINWKTNEKLFQNNYVKDFWIFRIYKYYRIDTLDLDKKKWQKYNGINQVERKMPIKTEI